MPEYRFIEPLDVLYLRGNRLFGEPGAHGEALMPPWPSTVSGALRSLMLVEGGIDATAYGREMQTPEGALLDVVGTPKSPGSFRIAFYSLAVRHGETVSSCFPLPADVVLHGDRPVRISYLRPTELTETITSSFHSRLHPPVLKTDRKEKPLTGRWLNARGLQAYLDGKDFEEGHLQLQSDLWGTDARLGIALDAESRTAAEGQIYTAEAVAPCRSDTENHHTGFLVGIDGGQGLVPREGLIRLGGDGRGAAIEACNTLVPEPDWQFIEHSRAFRIVLSTPGLFERGWLPPGLDDDNRWHGPQGVSARLVSAAVPRAQVVSGWNLAEWKPKPAQRAVPVGAVYWFDELEGGTEGLRKLAREGFWSINAYPDANRKAEGFSNVFIAAWAG
ncbi:MAG: type III-B CRISPR module-associated protein Cmr3 [Pseudomonadota bacterium]